MVLRLHNPHFHGLVHRQGLGCSPYAQPVKQVQENYQTYTLKDNLGMGSCTCLGEPPRGFCDVGCFWPRWRFFISLLFDVIPHPSVSYRQVFTPIFTTNATALSEHFYPCVLFTLHSDAARTTPPRILLCSCPHRVVPSVWHMDLNYWCLSYNTFNLSIAPVSHEA